MKSYSRENVRKITKTGSGSFYVIIPKEIVRALKWRERQKVKVKKEGRGIKISDWKKR
jgi:antitoxin component of MazEF toxin-antitoxin module